jgi:diguanylate cyclase (GGDEF)-like protein
VISLKRYLDVEGSRRIAAQAARSERESVALSCYRSLLLAIGKSAKYGGRALGLDLESVLTEFERQIDQNPSPESLREIEGKIESHLEEWGRKTELHLRQRGDEMKDFLLALARTADAISEHNVGNTRQLTGFTTNLEQISNLDDLALLRTSLMQRVADLKTTVDRMTKDNQRLVAQMQSEVANYETRLKQVEHLASLDALTGAASRRNTEEQIHLNFSNAIPFCVAMLDLNRFKGVNDRYGHQADDDLLRQFAANLHQSVRSGDFVGRWGGDEFILFLTCELVEAQKRVDRITKGVFRQYTIECGDGREAVSVFMDAAVGVAAWHPKQTLKQLISQVDAIMYQDKQRCHVRI